MTRVDRLTRQLEVQEQIAVAAGSLAASLQGGEEASATQLDLPPIVVTLAPMGTRPPLFVGMCRHVGALPSRRMVLPSPLQTRR